MENRTCVDCTVFIETQGMYGHPVFQTEAAWLQHRHESHGGPKPPEPQHDSPEPVKPDVAPEPEPEPFPQYATFIQIVDERFTDLERRVYLLEEAAAKTPAPAVVLPEPTPEG